MVESVSKLIRDPLVSKNRRVRHRQSLRLERMSVRSLGATC